MCYNISVKQYKVDFKANKNISRGIDIILNYYNALGFKKEEILLFIFSRGITDSIARFLQINENAFYRGYIDIDEYLDIKNLFENIEKELMETLQNKYIDSTSNLSSHDSED